MAEKSNKSKSKSKSKKAPALVETFVDDKHFIEAGPSSLMFLREACIRFKKRFKDSNDDYVSLQHKLLRAHGCDTLDLTRFRELLRRPKVCRRWLSMMAGGWIAGDISFQQQYAQHLSSVRRLQEEKKQRNEEGQELAILNYKFLQLCVEHKYPLEYAYMEGKRLHLTYGTLVLNRVDLHIGRRSYALQIGFADAADAIKSFESMEFVPIAGDPSTCGIEYVNPFVVENMVVGDELHCIAKPGSFPRRDIIMLRNAFTLRIETSRKHVLHIDMPTRRALQDHINSQKDQQLTDSRRSVVGFISKCVIVRPAVALEFAEFVAGLPRDVHKDDPTLNFGSYPYGWWRWVISRQSLALLESEQSTAAAPKPKPSRGGKHKAQSSRNKQ